MASETKALFTVEYESGEMLYVEGFSVFTSQAEAQDAKDSDEAYNGGLPLKIIRYVRAEDSTDAR